MRHLILILLATLALPLHAAGYSTMETFTMVSNCMIENGGQTRENLYMCSCRADVIMAAMDEEEYAHALTVEKYRELPADKGAVFRDTKMAQEKFAKLKQTRRKAAEDCPVIRAVTAKPAPAP